MTSNGTIQRIAIWVGGLFFIALLTYLSFHYARITDFPIGDDPAIHIHTIKTLSYSDILTTRYPAPLAIFKGLQQLTGIDHPWLFIVLICSFLFLATLSFSYFLSQSFAAWPVTVAGAIFFVTGRWVNDGLRMGLLAESFGWIVLFLAFWALMKRRIFILLALSLLLIFSHPFAVLVFGFVSLPYLLLALKSEKQQERQFARIVLPVYIILALTTWLVKPDLVSQFLLFNSTDPAGWGDRTLWEIVASDDERRLILPILAVFGAIFSLRHWQRPAVKISFLLFIVGLFLSLNHLFGTQFIPFRFYVYLETAIAFFAAVGLGIIVSRLSLRPVLAVILAGVLAILFAWPNYLTNESLGKWQATNPDAKAVMLPPDREALAWIKNNTGQASVIFGTRRQVVWLHALAERPNAQVSDLPYSSNLLIENISKGQLPAEYIYYPIGQAVPKEINEQYHLVFSKGGVTIWEANYVTQ